MKASTLLTKKGWCQHFLAVNKEGISVFPENPEAVAFCVAGALIKCYGEPRAYKLADKLAKHLCPRYWDAWVVIVEWNNHHTCTKAQVVKALKAVGL